MQLDNFGTGGAIKKCTPTQAKPVIRHFSQISIFCVKCNKAVAVDMHIINDLNVDRTNELKFECAYCGTLLKVVKL